MDVNTAASDAFLFLLRAAGQEEGPSRVEAGEQLGKALHSFFVNRNSRLKGRVVEEVMRRVPAVGALVVDQLLERCQGARHEFLQVGG